MPSAEHRPWLCTTICRCTRTSTASSSRSSGTHTRDFPREHKYAPGQDLKRLGTLLAGMTTTGALRSALSFTMKRQAPQRRTRRRGARRALRRAPCGSCGRSAGATARPALPPPLPTILPTCPCETVEIVALCGSVWRLGRHCRHGLGRLAMMESSVRFRASAPQKTSNRRCRIEDARDSVLPLYSVPFRRRQEQTQRRPRRPEHVPERWCRLPRPKPLRRLDLERRPLSLPAATGVDVRRHAEPRAERGDRVRRACADRGRIA